MVDGDGLRQLGEAAPSERVAVFEHFYYGRGALPWSYVEASICASLHCRPSELDEEDAARLLQGRTLLALGEIVQRFEQDLTSLKPREYEMIKDLVGKQSGG